MTLSRRNFIKIGGASLLSAGIGKNIQANPIKTNYDNLLKDVKPLTPADYEFRLEKARKIMKENQTGALLVMSGANLAYFTKVQWGESERPFGAIINYKGNPIWICPAFEAGRAKQRIPKDQEVRVWEEDESPYKLISGIMKDLGQNRLALAPNVRSFITYGLRKDAAAVELIDGSFITEGCRSIKTEKEIEFMELANKITKLAIKEAFSFLKEKISAEEVSKNISVAHQKLGAFGGGMVLIGPNSAFPHGSSDKHNLELNYPIMTDCGCSVEGFASDVTRTIIFGKPSEKHLRVYDIVKKAHSEALKSAKPGVTCGYIDQVARKIIEDSGFGPGYKYFSHRLGHGIGMEGHEYPYLLKGNDLKLQPGMTFSNEPGIYIPGEFGIRIEDCFVVTNDGSRHLGGMEATSLDKPFGE